ncbi:hypothetical protein [Paracraurococcus ruber]|uniref:Uncharacterized protein n=1 Tax=Paracraurococcus ruber TaxID=77675 RepID=A0ABS1D3E3_9PROT|nr:hypothetical protein [Paracraurococcus ruber]MBK1661376.1 hypothetical protein [Paracraurococcus ruber]TDG16146.1 hypothetical protein E2C05_29700 [Paracraurococcus ruber]
MTDFVIVAAALASIASAAPAPVLPSTAPTIGFRTYATIAACEDAVAHLPARPGIRLVCLPVEADDTVMSSHY